MNLFESWEVTRRHLNNALYQLPIETQQEERNVELLERVNEWLEYNELELALDDIEELGELNDVTATFWQELLVAANNMNLEKHAARYKAKLEALGDL